LRHWPPGTSKTPFVPHFFVETSDSRAYLPNCRVPSARPSRQISLWGQIEKICSPKYSTSAIPGGRRTKKPPFFTVKSQTTATPTRTTRSPFRMSYGPIAIIKTTTLPSPLELRQLPHKPFRYNILAVTILDRIFYNPMPPAKEITYLIQAIKWRTFRSWKRLAHSKPQSSTSRMLTALSPMR
jgi:hypothetical protein